MIENRGKKRRKNKTTTETMMMMIVCTHLNPSRKVHWTIWKISLVHYCTVLHMHFCLSDWIKDYIKIMIHIFRTIEFSIKSTSIRSHILSRIHSLFPAHMSFCSIFSGFMFSIFYVLKPHRHSIAHRAQHNSFARSFVCSFTLASIWHWGWDTLIPLAYIVPD